MESRFEQHHLPWDAAKMFDLVADIERYHEFLPLWTQARITRRAGDTLFVTQGIEFGLLHLEFESRAELQRPERLRVSSTAGPFRSLLIDWRFAPVAGSGCEVTLSVTVEMRSVLLEAGSGRLLDGLTRDIFTRFHDRAQLLYGA